MSAGLGGMAYGTMASYSMECPNFPLSTLVLKQTSIPNILISSSLPYSVFA